MGREKLANMVDGTRKGKAEKTPTSAEKFDRFHK
jgi:hypothetical protein